MARILGLDITTDAIFAALVQTSFRKWTVERYVQLPLTVTEPGVARRTEIAEALAALPNALGGPPDTVMVAAAGEHVSLHRVELPAAVQKRVGDVLPLELETLLPVTSDQTVVDWQPISSDATSIVVLAASILRERVAEQLADLQAVRIDPREIGAGATVMDGLVALLPDLRTTPTTIVDLGMHHTDICILDAGRCAHARTITTGLASFPNGADALARSIRQTLAGYRAAGGGESTQVLLTGPGALAPGGAEWLTAQLGVLTSVIELPDAGDNAAHRPLFARATALAARGVSTERRINLRTGAFAAKRSAGSMRAHAALIAACTVAVLLSLVFSVRARRSMLEEERDALLAELEGTTKQIFGRSITDAEALQSILKNPRAGDPLPIFDAFAAVGAVSASVPTTMKHDVRRLRVEIGDDKREGRMELQGSLSTIEERDALVAQLEQHECFHDIERGRTTPARGEQSINYQIEATIRCSGDPAPKKTTKRSSP